MSPQPRTRAGQLLIVGFEGTTAPELLLRRIAEGRVGGVVLFTRNLGSPAEIAALTRSLQAATPAGDPPIVVSIDQEGGRVQRVRAPNTVWPAMARLAAHGDEGLTEAVGLALGAEIAALGFNVDFAPVLDVHTNPQNPIIGDRAFGTDAAGATAQGLAFWRGLERAGVRGCGKHFPGHGDTATDSHLELPRVDHDEARLRAVELAPFAAAARAGVPMIMTAHVVYPAVDARPATMSHRWLTAILRLELGFRGVIVSDDLDMKAVADQFPVEETVVRSLAAGADCFLACRDPGIQQRAEEALEAGAARDAALQVRLEESAARLRGFRQTLRGAPPADSERAIEASLETHAALALRARGA
jgi:beta-N-acetylhexosaminidase